MRTLTHAQIIDDAGGVAAMRKALVEAGFDGLPDETVRSWPKAHRGVGSIPPEYWLTVAGLKLATLEQLAAAAEGRRFPDLAARRARAAEIAA